MTTIDRLPTVSLRRRLLAAAIALTASAGSSADVSAEEARRLAAAGEIVPLRRLLAQYEAILRGRLLDAELEHEHGAYLYEITMLTGDRRLERWIVDARGKQPPRLRRHR